MTTSNQALFSKPILAALMVLITLLIWVLNATAPAARFAQPSVETWQTQSMIPVTWLDQDIWQGTNKLEIRLRFNHGRADDKQQGVTDALFALLLLDTLPLSRSSINKRLESTATTVDYHVSEDDSELAITLNSEQRFLDPSLKILTTWFNAPVFKERTFSRWQQNETSYYLSPKAQLSQHLYPTIEGSALGSVMGEYGLSLEDIQHHYQTLIHKVDKITLVGHIPNPKAFKTSLDNLTEGFEHVTVDKNVRHAEQVALYTQDGERLLQSHGAIAIKELNSVEDWISLQLWLRYFVTQLNQQPENEYVQLHLERSNLRQWVWWSTQHHQHILQEAETNKNIPQDSYATKAILESSFTSITSSEFDHLLEGLEGKIAEQSKSPTWWARIASQETPNQQNLNLENWLENYASSLQKISFEQYKQSLDRIVLKESYQEIQNRQ